MRRWILIVGLLAVAGLGYTLWPFVGLYQLGSALHAADAETALSLIDVTAVRRSLLRQILDEGTKGTKIEKRLGHVGRRMAMKVAADALDRKMAEIVTRDVLRQLIAEGRLPSSFADLRAPAAGAPSSVPAEPVDHRTDGAAIGVPGNPLRFLQSWRFRSFRQFDVVLGETGKPNEWTGLTLRRKGVRWRLTSIKLSKAVIARIKAPIREKLDAVHF